MTAARHWTDFPPSLVETIQKLEREGSIRFGPCPKADAYNWRNELYRFRKAVMRAFHDDKDAIASDLMDPLRSMTVRLAEHNQMAQVAGTDPVYTVTVSYFRPPRVQELEPNMGDTVLNNLVLSISTGARLPVPAARDVVLYLQQEGWSFTHDPSNAGLGADPGSTA